MSAFTDALDDLMRRQLAATTPEERRAIFDERTELLRRHHQGEFAEDPKPPRPVNSELHGFDAKMAQTGERDE